MSDGESGDGDELIEMLFEAIEEDNEEAVEEALEEGAEVDSLNEDGYTPLIFAAESGSATACEVLLVNDADPNDQMEENGYTALHAAAASNESDIVEMLLESEADPSVSGCSGSSQRTERSIFILVLLFSFFFIIAHVHFLGFILLMSGRCAALPMCSRRCSRRMVGIVADSTRGERQGARG